jgi:hypothetical protein
MPAADETRKRIRTNPLKTIADVRDAQRALALMEYLLTPVLLFTPGDSTPRKMPACSECKATVGSVYQIRGVWYCLDHIPAGTTFPVGLHGDEFKAYQERQK